METSKVPPPTPECRSCQCPATWTLQMHTCRVLTQPIRSCFSCSRCFPPRWPEMALTSDLRVYCGSYSELYKWSNCCTFIFSCVWSGQGASTQQIAVHRETLCFYYDLFLIYHFEKNSIIRLKVSSIAFCGNSYTHTHTHKCLVLQQQTNLCFHEGGYVFISVCLVVSSFTLKLLPWHFAEKFRMRKMSVSLTSHNWVFFSIFFYFSENNSWI